MPKTKIIATLGPASETQQTITKLINAGVDIFRFNSKHGQIKTHQKTIDTVKKVSQQSNRPLGTLIDLQGPEIRIKTPDEQPLEVNQTEEILLTVKPIPDHKYILLNQPSVIENIQMNQLVLIDDGLYPFRVVKKQKHQVSVQALATYTIETNKSLNLPGVDLDLPLLTKQDHEFIKLAVKEKATFLALSFVRSAKDIEKLRRTANKIGFQGGIIAKIENKSAIDKIDEIIEASDAIMIARGDLGIEVPIEKIAYLQNVIIQKCRHQARPVITATQMLQSMTQNPVPSRAEVTDVANAILDGTDAIMLSAETATGKYPVESVQVMSKIAKYNEERNSTPALKLDGRVNQTESITHAVMDIIEQQRDYSIDSIVVFTETGRTAKSLSRFRPKIPAFAITPSETVQKKLTLSYAVNPLTVKMKPGERVSTTKIIQILKKRKNAQKGHRILFIHGDQWMVPGQTNTIVIREVV